MTSPGFCNVMVKQEPLDEHEHTDTRTEVMNEMIKPKIEIEINEVAVEYEQNYPNLNVKCEIKRESLSDEEFNTSYNDQTIGMSAKTEPTVELNRELDTHNVEKDGSNLTHSEINILVNQATAYIQNKFKELVGNSERQTKTKSNILNRKTTAQDILGKPCEKQSVSKFMCKVCKKPFENRKSMEKHLRILHGVAETLFTCPLCAKTFTKKYNLVRHTQNIHEENSLLKSKNAAKALDLPKVQCDICKKYYGRKQELVVHIRIHTGDKPFKCDVCKKHFTQKANLARHKQIHEEKVVKDRIFSCDVCSKTFSEKSTLTVHSRVHTGLRPYKCKICPKAFSYTSTLKIHERSHTGEKPHRCRFCNKGFSRKYTMRNHEKVHFS